MDRANQNRQVRNVLGYILLISMTVTVVLLLLQGRWKDALPLHLCSLSGLCAAYLALKPRGWALDALWYLGMPGAVLALLFPAPAVSGMQMLMNLSYGVTHLLIVMIPAFLVCAGMRPTRGMACTAILLLQGIAAMAYGVNHLLGTDFMFLMSPPAGTPLETVYAWGYPVYLLTLEMLAIALCMSMDYLAGFFFVKNGQ